MCRSSSGNQVLTLGTDLTLDTPVHWWFAESVCEGRE